MGCFITMLRKLLDLNTQDVSNRLKKNITNNKLNIEIDKQHRSVTSSLFFNKNLTNDD